MSTSNKYSGDGGIMQEMGGGNDGLAPSERHLEDWIWTNPLCLGENEAPGCEGEPQYRLLDRQSPLPSGIVDIVAHDGRLTLLELKKGEIDFRAVVQVLRYMNDVKAIWYELMLDHFMERRPHYNAVKYHDMVNGSAFDQFVRGILIGRSVKDSRLHLACAVANVEIWTYRFDGQHYHFNENIPRITNLTEYFAQEDERKREMLSTPIGRAARETLESCLAYYCRNTRRFDAVRAAEDHLSTSADDEVAS